MRNTTDLIQAARETAEAAHAGQTRRGSSEPYFRHAERVAVTAERRGLSAAAIAAAYLHDVVEDTDVDISDFPPRVQFIVDCLTRRKKSPPKETKSSAILRVLESYDREVVMLKMLDRYDNLADALDTRVFSEEYLPTYLHLTETLLDGAWIIGFRGTEFQEVYLELRARVDSLFEELNEVQWAEYEEMHREVRKWNR